MEIGSLISVASKAKGSIDRRRNNRIRWIKKKGVPMLSEILGFVIILILFSYVLNLTYGNEEPLTFASLLNILQRPPTNILNIENITGTSEILTFFSSVLAQSDLPVIGPIFNVIGNVGIFVFRSISWILNGLHMIASVFTWVVMALFPGAYL